MSRLSSRSLSKVFTKLIENGVEYPKGSPVYTFKTLDEQGL